MSIPLNRATDPAFDGTRASLAARSGTPGRHSSTLAWRQTLALPAAEGVDELAALLTPAG